MKERCRYIDETRAVGILMVVISHICNASGMSNPVRDWFNPFMVGLFFIISGGLYGMRGKRQENFSDFFIKRVKSLAVPYVFFSFTAGIIQLIVAFERMISVREEAVRLLIDFITLKGFGPIWFLPVMFLAEVCFYFVVKGNKIVHGLTAAAGVAAVYLAPAAAEYISAVSFGRASWAGGYIGVLLKTVVGTSTMMIGYYILPWLDQMRKRLIWAVMGCLCLAATVGIVRIYNMDFNGLDFGSIPALYFVDCIFGTILIIMCCRLADSFVSLDLLSYLGKNTLIIMCTHTEWYLVPMICAGWAQIAGQAVLVGERYYGELIIKLLFLVAIEVGIIELLHKYCPFIPGSRMG